MKYIITFIAGVVVGIGSLLMGVWFYEERFKYSWPREKKGK